MTATDPEMPLFPLNTVLFPGGLLPLRIFEPRYVDMVGRSMREGTPFGVIPIRSGPEAGGVVETAEIGTTVRIVDFSKLPDGLLGITSGVRSHVLQPQLSSCASSEEQHECPKFFYCRSKASWQS